MSVKVMARVWAQSTRKDGELLVMLALADFANDQGECWPSIPVLAEKARLTERQVRRVLDKLEDIGEIRRIRSTGGRNRRTRYFLTLPENADIITGKKLQGNEENPDMEDRKTLVPVSGALNHHRTVNKNTEPNGSESLSHSKKRKQSAPDPAILTAFHEFYQAFPRHVAKQEAERAWRKLNPDAELVKAIMAGVRRYAEEVKGAEPQYIKHPGPWLNGRRWEDEVEGANRSDREPVVKDLGNGLLEVDGKRMTKQTYELRYGSKAKR